MFHSINVTITMLSLVVSTLCTGQDDGHQAPQVQKKINKNIKLNYLSWPTPTDLLRYPLGRDGVYAPGGHDCLANSRQKFSNIVSLTALRLAFFMGYE